MFRWEVVGAENVPAAGGVLLCANHRSNWDPPLLGASVSRPVYFMAKEELFRVPFLAWWMKVVGAFPVKRGAADLGSIRRALTLLKDGHAVAVFPEGTRSRTGMLQEAHGGGALLAIMSGAPVIPVAIAGKMRPFRRVQVRIGSPVDLSPYRKKGRRRSQELAAIANEAIMGRIRELLAEVQAGVPDEVRDSGNNSG